MSLFHGFLILISLAGLSQLVPLPNQGNGAVGIIDPAYTDIGTHSYTVAILTGMDLLGGGALITQWWFITAASVVHGYQTTDIGVRLGSNSPYFGGHLQNISVLIEHPQYANQSSYNLALGKLKRPAMFRVAAHISYIARVPFQADKSYANLTGYGQQTYTTEVADASGLQILELELYSSSYCNYHMYVTVPDEQFCAQNYFSAPCFGDAGDPLARCVRQGQCELLGIYTGVDPCDTYNPSTYMDIGQFYDWIQQTIA